jgi:hypothetical protein
MDNLLFRNHSEYMGFFTLFGCVQTNAMLSLEKCNFCLVVLYVVHVVCCCMSLTFLMNWGIVLPRLVSWSKPTWSMTQAWRPQLQFGCSLGCTCGLFMNLEVMSLTFFNELGHCVTKIWRADPSLLEPWHRLGGQLRSSSWNYLASLELGMHLFPYKTYLH